MNDRPLIAVVDDDASVRKGLERLLRSARLDVLTYASGADFLRNGESHNPDCLVLDIQMPEMTGIELRDRMRPHPRQVPIVFITAHDDDEARRRAVGDGEAPYLRKPFGDDELLTARIGSWVVQCRHPDGAISILAREPRHGTRPLLLFRYEGSVPNPAT